MNNWKSYLPHIISLVVILTINVMYFFPQFEGKVVQQGDIISVKAMGRESVVYNEKSDNPTLWTNSMFGGMPTFQISAPNRGNKLSIIDKTISLGFKAPTATFLLGMFAFYISMILLGLNPWLSLLGALLFGLSTNNMILYEAGHTSKIRAIMTSAPIIVGLILTFRKKYLLGGLIFGIALGLNLYANHVQMSYYLAITLLILVLIYFVSAIKNGAILDFFKSSAILLIGTLLALGSSASRIWTTYEYSQDTMRGKPILEVTSDTITSSSQVDGLEYNYAMQWSNGNLDLLSSFIPKVAGGSSGEWLDKDSPLAKKVGSRKPLQAPTYYGSLPFTSGPSYFGAVAFFLFLFGAFVVKGRFKWWLVAGTVLTLLLSMGKNFELLNRFMFDYFPMYNKFRTPNSVLSITVVFIPILAILGLSEIIKSDKKESYIKSLYISAGILGGISLFLILLGSSFIDFESAGDARYKEIADVLLEQRQSMLSSSSLRTLFLVLLSAGAIWLYLKDKIGNTILISIIGVLGVLDLLIIDKGYLGSDSFVSERNYKNNFEPRPVDQQILADPDPHYRVYDATLNDPYQNASPSYHHKMIGGYHAAKLQRIQDVIDKHLSKGNMEVFNMLNTKYFIVPGEGDNLRANLNPAARGNAWFVNKVVVVDNANAEIDSLTNFDSTQKAFVHKEFQSYVQNISLTDSVSNIKLTSYHPDKLTYDANVGNGEQLAVFSETWYGPDKGWQAYIDEKPVDHIRVNYLLRALKIPQGKHNITFEFKPKSYYTGEMISLVSSLILLLSMIGYIVYSFMNKNKLSKDNA